MSQKSLFLSKKKGVDTTGAWHHVLAAAVGRSFETFQAVQRLCNPSDTHQFWADAFVLTRLHFETLVTLEWIAQDQEARSEMLLDERALKEAHFLAALGVEAQKIAAERRKQIDQEREKVEKKYKLNPKALSLIPCIQSMVEELGAPLNKTYPHLKLEYELYYRDVSGFAHPSAWGLQQSMTESDTGLVAIGSTPKVGEKALLSNGGQFLKILRLFNLLFNVLPDAEIVGWQDHWAKAVNLPESLAEGI